MSRKDNIRICLDCGKSYIDEENLYGGYCKECDDEIETEELQRLGF